MSEIQAHSADEAERLEARKLEAATAFITADLACPFGPSFFLGHLGTFVRNHCPDPQENLPVVQLYLANAETLDVCHIIGVSPRWVMLAIRDAASHRDDMAIEIVPYALIQRVSIRTRHHADGASIGFSETRAPAIIGAETLLHAAMSPGPGRKG